MSEEPDYVPLDDVLDEGSGRYAPAREGLIIRRVSDVPMEKISWLWPKRIARGKLTVIAGHPGLGKSQVTAWMAATVTTGRPWPGSDQRAEPGNVLILNAEDAVADTIRPRLIAAGADDSKVYVIDAVRADGDGKERNFSLETDLAHLESAIAEIGGATLITIDPITAYLGKVDGNSNSEVRGVLGPLSALAERQDAAVIGVSHLNKSGGNEALMRIIGSVGFVGAARAAYAVLKDPAEPSRRLFLPVKNNIGIDSTGYAFKVEPVTLPNGIETSRVTWEPDEVTTTADEAMEAAQNSMKSSVLADAVAFLRDKLAFGPVKQTEVREHADAEGISKRTLDRAKKELCVTSVKASDHWVWCLPDP
jgi:putative DNA primase/helicase